MKLNNLYPLKDDWYTKLFFFLLVVMIVAVPFSRFLMSVSQFGFGALWLAHGRYKEKIQAFLKNPAAIVFTSIYLFHVLGLAWSEDMDYALKDIRIKLPLLIIPFMFAGFPKITPKQFKVLIYFLLASVLFVSIYLSVAYFGYQMDVKKVLQSAFISHIRYSLSLNLAIFYLLIQGLRDQKRSWKDLIFLLVLLWLIWFVFFLEAFTGVIVFFILGFVVLTYFALQTGKFYKKFIYFSAITLGGLGIVWFIAGFTKDYYKAEPVNLSNLELRTASGNKYLHDTINGFENGKYLYIYLNYKEMREVWNQRSEFDFDGKDQKGQSLKFTLIRYMTSKDLRKDKEGMMTLSDKDIRNIERGIANYQYTEGFGVKSRLMKILFEYDNYRRTGDPSGHSVMQRVEYWKTSWSIIQKHFWFGVGTGDMNKAFDREYDLLDSKLAEDVRLRSHNQYLSIWVGLGFVGFVIFLISIFYPPLKTNAFKNIYYVLFFITFVASMLTEDTIETQAGATFYVYFSSLFLFLIPHSEEEVTKKSHEENRSIITQ